MADQCIVCLDDLDTVNPVPDRVKLELHDDDRLAFDDVPERQPNNTPNGQLVAKIIPCSHYLHDDCVKEWTMKANSCPICRTSFHLVEVYDKVGGTLLHDRIVEDKKQVAEFDPSAWIDDQVEADSPPCPICGNNDEEEVLLLCDGCDAPYHTHCVGLDAVPSSHWFCMECVHQGATNRSSDPERLTRLRTSRQPRSWAQRTQAQVRRARHRYTPDAWSGAWNQISERVWTNLDLDLEYGDDDSSLLDYRRLQTRTDRSQRDFRQWQQRLNIANRQGAGRLFESAARPHLAVRQQPPEAPKQSKEEEQAWDAFDRLGRVDASPSSRKRKRTPKSATSSPTEVQKEPERKLKRPKTRRVVEKPESAASMNQAGSSRRKSDPQAINSPTRPATALAEAPGGPSFLSSLLKEVEMSTPSEDEALSISIPATAGSPLADITSPATSPVVSSYSTPRAMSATPPPIHERRPGSPLPLTSRVEPIYPRADYYSVRSSTDTPENCHANEIEIRQPRPRQKQSSFARSPGSSPSRPQITRETKEGISKIVRTALEPHYKKISGGITKDQYATINRLVSHMLYDKIANQEALEDEKAKMMWETIADAEVTKAVEGLTA